MNIQLLIIDPQEDFVNQSIGSLAVKNADKDMDRLAIMIKRAGRNINRIHITTDQHRKKSIFHTCWWTDKNGKEPTPFTVIKANDIMNGTWHSDISVVDRSYAYVKELNRLGKYDLVLWPNHCLINSPGANVVPDILDAAFSWERSYFGGTNIVNFVGKGTNPYTENYSAIKAEVEDPTDPSTQLNTKLIQELSKADVILVGGEALSHCLKSTVEDLVSNNIPASKIVLLADCSSSVGGFENQGDEFVKSMVIKGAKLINSADILKI